MKRSIIIRARVGTPTLLGGNTWHSLFVQIEHKNIFSKLKLFES